MLVVVTILAEIFMPQIMVAFVPGFVDDKEKFDLTVLLTRIMFPYLACMSLMAAYGAILNSLGRFFAAAFAPVILNIVNIAAMIPLVTFWVQDPEGAAIWVASPPWSAGSRSWRWSGAAISAPISCRSSACRGSIRKCGASGCWPFRRSSPAASPRSTSSSAPSSPRAPTSAISILNYADRLYQLPLGIIGIAIGTVLLPELSRHLKGGRDVEARATQDQSLLRRDAAVDAGGHGADRHGRADRAGAVRARRLRCAGDAARRRRR